MSDGQLWPRISDQYTICTLTCSVTINNKSSLMQHELCSYLCMYKQILILTCRKCFISRGSLSTTVQLKEAGTAGGSEFLCHQWQLRISSPPQTCWKKNLPMSIFLCLFYLELLRYRYQCRKMPPIPPKCWYWYRQVPVCAPIRYHVIY